MERLVITGGALHDNITHYIEYEQSAARDGLWVALCSCGWTDEFQYYDKMQDAIVEHVRLYSRGD